MHPEIIRQSIAAAATTTVITTVHTKLRNRISANEFHMYKFGAKKRKCYFAK